jgi:probable DNA repair protein
MASRCESFGKAVEAALAGATVLTVNTRAARQLKAEYDRRMRAMRQTWLSPEILPLSAWLQRTINDALVSGATSSIVLAPAQQTAVWNRIIRESKRGPAVAQSSTTVETALDAWVLLHAYRARLDSEAFRSSEETRSFQAWAREYARLCNDNSWTDTARLPDQVAALADRLRLARTYVLFGFDELTPQIHALLSALTRCGAGVNVLHEDGPEFSSALSLSLPDTACELRSAATWARNRLQAEPATRIGIIVPNLQAVLPQIEHALIEILHPESLVAGSAESRHAFDISLGPSLSGYAVIQSALIVLRLIAAPVPQSDIQLLLRSPYIAGGESERGARACFDVYLREHARPKLSFADLCGALRSAPSYASCPVLLRVLDQAAKMAGAWVSSARAAAWSQRAGDVLEAMGWPGESERPLNSAEFQAVARWSQLLSEFAALDSFLDPLSAGAFVETIEELADSRVFRPENEGAPVQVMGPLEAAGSEFDHVWFCGLTDSVWPSGVRLNPFLPAQLQRDLIMPHSSAARELAFARKITRRLAASTEEFVLSWPKHEQDQELRASPLLAGVDLGDASGICGPSAPSWATLQRDARQETFQDETAPPVTVEGMYRGGTRVFESQSRCPFMCFAQMRLGAKPLDEPADGLTPIERGRAIERALQLVWDRLRDSYTLQNTSQDELEKIVADAVDQAMRETFPITRERWEKRYSELERQRLNMLTREWLEIEKRRSAFEVIEHQRKTTITAGPLTVNGRIDRLDKSIHDDGVVVIDYKSGGGSYGPGQWEGERPRSPQLPLYAIMQDREVAAIAFSTLRRGDCGFAGYGKRKEILGQKKDNSSRYLNGDTFEQHIAKWRSVMASLAEDHVRGVATVDPLDQDVCKYCDFGAVCRVAEAVSVSEDEGDHEH